MIDPYASEDEQVEAIKKWLKENISSIIAGIIIGLGGIFGWQLWTNYQTDEAEQALRRAYKLIKAKADQIGNPELQRSYLENVRVNADIMAEMAKIAGEQGGQGALLY